MIKLYLNKNLTKSKAIKIILILILFCILILTIEQVRYLKSNLYYKNFIDHTKKSYILNVVNEFSSKEISEKCEPFLDIKKQYVVNLNGSLYPKSLPLCLNKSINFNCLQKTRTIKKILFWTPFFERDDYEYGLGSQIPFIKNRCPVTKCELTNDKNQINSSDLVIFHMWENFSLPSIRKNDQRWVFLTYESPIRSPRYQKYRAIFNLTSSYRADSDFSHFYETWSQMEWKENKNFDENYDFYSSKFEFAAAVISNCVELSKRLEYINELKKYVPVKVFGACGEPCPNKFKSLIPGNCKDIIGREYKFYLAFENSFCKDYITEKFFAILKYDIIPIVLGGGTYENYIPKSGFINVKDFSSPKELADYMMYLDRNKDKYNSYFKWKKYVVFSDKNPWLYPLCDMCIKLHLENYTGYKYKYIDDIDGYWNNNTCIIPQKNSYNNFQFL